MGAETAGHPAAAVAGLGGPHDNAHAVVENPLHPWNPHGRLQVGPRVGTFVPCRGNRKNKIPTSVQKAVDEKAQSVSLDGFGENVVYDSFADFLSDWSSYMIAHHFRVRFRNTTTRDKQNKELLESHARRGVPRPKNDAYKIRYDQPEAPQIPEHLTHGNVGIRCNQGCFQPSRSKKIREPVSSKYIGCDARVTAKAVQAPDGQWVVITESEWATHSHPCTPFQVQSVTGKSNLVVERNLLPLEKMLLEAKTPTRNICAIISEAIGEPFNAQHLANLKRDKLELNEPLANLRSLLGRYNALEGNEVVLVKDDQNKVRAIAMQSAAQREMFLRFGDNLVMDFTYNTNNHRFNLGSLIVTSSSSGGVSVFDFLCVNQTKVLVKEVIDHFLRLNPGAATRVVSIVIDKDYVE